MEWESPKNKLKKQKPFQPDPGWSIPKKIENKFKNVILALFLAKHGWDQLKKT